MKTLINKITPTVCNFRQKSQFIQSITQRFSRTELKTIQFHYKLTAMHMHMDFLLTGSHTLKKVSSNSFEFPTPQSTPLNS